MGVDPAGTYWFGIGHGGLAPDLARKPEHPCIAGDHICRGNFRSAWAAEGGYDPVQRFYSMNLSSTVFFSNMTRFLSLRLVPRDKKIVLGLVTTKTGEMETADELKRRIDEAARYVPLEQLALSPQCGFSSTVLGNNITVEAEIAKLALVVRVAGEVWG